MRPILLPVASVNQSAASGPETVPVGRLSGVGTVNSRTLPFVLMRPILLPLSSANHSAPSGPGVICAGALSLVGISNSRTLPFVEMRPILLAPYSVNHIAWSGPSAIVIGRLDAVGTSYSRTRGAAAVAGTASRTEAAPQATRWRRFNARPRRPPSSQPRP